MRVAEKVFHTDKSIENEDPQEKTIDTDTPLEKTRCAMKSKEKKPRCVKKPSIKKKAK